MTVPKSEIKPFISNAVNVARQRVLDRAEELFTSEIASAGNGGSSPFQKILLPEAKVFTSFERSLSASLGKAFDYIAAAIARATYGNGVHDHHLTGTIKSDTITEIEAIIRRYQQRVNAAPDTTSELDQLKASIQGQSQALAREVKSDVYFVDHEGFENYLEIKTPMPNYDQCAAMKTRILTIRAMLFDKADLVRAMAVFPHNPNGLIGEYAWPPLRYFLDPGHDWAARGMKMMGPGLWNFIGNSEDTYSQLLECFYEVSLEHKDNLLELLKIT